MSNINDFLSSFKTDLARPCNFDVMIIPTSVDLITALAGASIKSWSNPLDLTFRCEAAELPSRMFTAVSQKTYGPEQLIPIQNVFNKINLTFICSDDMFERFYFEAWLNYMSNASFFPFPTGIGSVADLISLRGPEVNYDFQYRNNYESLIIITQYDVANKPSYYVGLFHAFPIGINENPLSWDAVNQTHKVTVTFAYTYYNSAVSLGSTGLPAF